MKLVIEIEGGEHPFTGEKTDLDVQGVLADLAVMVGLEVPDGKIVGWARIE